jgi:hypothetical protein
MTTSRIGIAALAAGIVAALLETALLANNYLPAPDITLTLLAIVSPLVTIAAIVLCTIAGFRGQRRLGLIGGVLTLIPGLFAIGVIVTLITGAGGV